MRARTPNLLHWQGIHLSWIWWAEGHLMDYPFWALTQVESRFQSSPTIKEFDSVKEISIWHAGLQRGKSLKLKSWTIGPKTLIIKAPTVTFHIKLANYTPMLMDHFTHEPQTRLLGTFPTCELETCQLPTYLANTSFDQLFYKILCTFYFDKM